QFFSSGSGLGTSTGKALGVSDNLGWGSTSSIITALGTKNLVISEVAPAAGTYYMALGSGGYTNDTGTAGSAAVGNSLSNGIQATTAGQVLQWVIVNPTASDVYWFNASQTSSLTTHSGAVTNAGVGPIGFSAAAPEPATLGLLAVGAIGLLAARRKTRHSH
ncbi:MAG: PEP-CTERM sorting domain-containing protein, partial [Phycisphaerae bacterium]